MLSASLEQTTLIALSVFIISCPCALVIATPLAFQVGLAKIAKAKAIFKSARNFGKIGKINTVVFDKTGSLTQGKPKVIPEQYMTKLSNKNKSRKKILGGNLDFMLENKVKITKNCQSIIQQHKDKSIFLFAVDTTAIAVYFLEDSIREGAKPLITTLKKKGMDIYVSSGDRKNPSLKFASQLGIAENKVLFQQSSQDKLNFIQKLQSKGRLVLMLGDGWNDAPALTQADLSLTLTSGTDATLEAADIILLTPDLNRLLLLFKISQSTLKLVRQNIIISLVYNFIAIPLAIFGLVIPFRPFMFAASSKFATFFAAICMSSGDRKKPQDK